MLFGLNDIFSGAVAADGTKTAQAITATAISTNVIDMRNAATPALVDEGIVGQEAWLYVGVVQVFNTLTSLTITLESDVASSLASSPVVHATKSVLLAALTAGATVWRIPLPSDDYKRYIGLRYTVVGSNPSTGSIVAEIVLEPQRNVIYPSGYTIDV